MAEQLGSPAESASSLYNQSPLAFIQPRHKNRATYVQRWKVLRERNKSLPKLDFNAKANGIPKKFQAATSFSRSYTYDSMKLPSLSTCSVVTGVSNKSVQSDGYRRKDKKSIQEHSVTSDSYTDLTGQKDLVDVGTNLSKSLHSLDERTGSTEKVASSKHRYERITYQKHLSNRRRNNKGFQKEPTLLNKEKTTMSLHSDRTGYNPDRHTHKDSGERQYVYVKNHRKDKQNFPHILDTLKRENELKERRAEKNAHGHDSTYSYPNDTMPSLEARSIPETQTLTSDDVTIRSSSTTRVCSPKSTLTISSSARPLNMSVYDTDLINCD